MKANTIQLLIAVIAVVGTLSSTIPQSFADNDQPYEAVCLPDLDLANNGDPHSMMITGGGNVDNDLFIAASIGLQICMRQTPKSVLDKLDEAILI